MNERMHERTNDGLNVSQYRIHSTDYNTAHAHAHAHSKHGDEIEKRIKSHITINGCDIFDGRNVNELMLGVGINRSHTQTHTHTDKDRHTTSSIKSACFCSRTIDFTRKFYEKIVSFQSKKSTMCITTTPIQISNIIAHTKNCQFIKV